MDPELLKSAKFWMKELLAPEQFWGHGRGCDCEACCTYLEIRDAQKEKYLLLTGEEYVEPDETLGEPNAIDLREDGPIGGGDHLGDQVSEAAALQTDQVDVPGVRLQDDSNDLGRPDIHEHTASGADDSSRMGTRETAEGQE